MLIHQDFDNKLSTIVAKFLSDLNSHLHMSDIDRIELSLKMNTDCNPELSIKVDRQARVDVKLKPLDKNELAGIREYRPCIFGVIQDE